jgi:hypothetical protein
MSLYDEEKGKSIEEEIDNFVSFFQENLNAIKSAKFEVRENPFKKILCVGIIDALSKAIYPKSKIFQSS